MKKTIVKKILVILTLVIAVTLLTTTVKATGNPLNIQGLVPSTNSNGSGTVNVTQKPNTTQQTTNTAQSNGLESAYQNRNLPQTGDASDYAIFLFIAVCAVVAVYAYRKYKNYNI